MDSVRVTPQPCRGHGHLCASLDGDLMLSGMVHQLTLCRRGMSAKACKPNLWKSRRRLSDRQRATAVHSLCLFLVGAFFASLAETLSTTLSLFLSLSLPLSLSPSPLSSAGCLSAAPSWFERLRSIEVHYFRSACQSWNTILGFKHNQLGGT